jgi:hypothetical protein
VGLEVLYQVISVELLQWIVRQRIFYVSEDTCLSGTHFHASRLKTPGDAMIAKTALLSGVRDGIHEPAAIGASLYAEATANAIVRIHQHGPIRRIEGRPHRTDLRAR